MTLFGRTEKPTPAATPSLDELAAAGKKGRPTPSRKEAEAAAKERARAGMDKKAAAKLLREKRSDSNRKMREGMKSGDERYLPARDQGPVKRYVRDWVDSRLMFTELVLPLLLVILIASTAPKDSALAKGAGYLQLVTMAVLFVEVVSLRFRLRKSLAAEFPDESYRGTTFYALTRMLQLRFMRLPKPKVKLGGRPV
ncbi:MAG: rane protein [Marmoricola sp.]|nr:rane protein [Marmoricola sp.]